MFEEYENQKSEYRKIFLQCAWTVFEYLNSKKPNNFEGDIFDKYDSGTDGKLWQSKVLEFIDNVFLNDISQKRQYIMDERKKYKCLQCGECCRFACSENSFEKLKTKSKNDNTAKEFIETFIPYNTIEEARKVFPQYIKLLEENDLDNYFIYHCPKVTDDNKCPQYENRPKICADFPDNPLAFLPKNCGFNKWRKDTYKILLEIMAKSEIAEFYKTNIKGYTKDENIIRLNPPRN